MPTAYALVTAGDTMPAVLNDERSDQVARVGVGAAHETIISCYSYATRLGVSRAPARSTSSVVWYPTRPMSQAWVATTPRQLPSEMDDMNKKPRRMATITCSRPSKPKHCEAPLPRLTDRKSTRLNSSH